MITEQRREYMRNKMRERRAKEKEQRVSPEASKPREYTDKAKLEIAVERSERARSYADKFPEMISEADKRFQTVDWQYNKEAGEQPRLQEVTQYPDRKYNPNGSLILMQFTCGLCKRSWSASKSIQCPYCKRSA